MKKITINCKTVTPLFMKGANDNFELRASSIKGLLRFWWRTYNYEDNINKLKIKENRIFGGETVIRDKEVSIISPVTIKVSYNAKHSIEVKSNAIINKSNELKYLFYSMLLNDNKMLKADSSFKIQFNYRYNEYCNEKTLMNYIYALNLLQLLGGIGSRTTRGAGNFHITEIDADDNNLKQKIEDVLVVKRELNSFEDVREYINKSINNYKKDTTSGNIKYFNILGNNFSVYILDNFEIRTWNEALSEIGKLYKEFRKQRDRDIKKAVFGLPLSLGKNGKQKVEISVNNMNLDRVQSPLRFKILKTGQTYVPLIIRLDGGSLDKNKGKIINNKTKKELNMFIDNERNLIDGFLAKEEFLRIY